MKRLMFLFFILSFVLMYDAFAFVIPSSTTTTATEVTTTTTSIISSKTGFVSGVVKSCETGNAVDSATITDLSSDVYTVFNKAYFIAIPINDNTSITCAATGYQTLTKSIPILENTTTQLSWSLSPNSCLPLSEPKKTNPRAGVTVVGNSWKFSFLNTNPSSFEVKIKSEAGALLWTGSGTQSDCTETECSIAPPTLTSNKSYLWWIETIKVDDCCEAQIWAESRFTKIKE